MQEANITTIYKKKGSRLSLENDRGIFGTNILKRIIDKLVYNDKYDEIDAGMSDSNIGGRKKMNIKNHLFVIYGIINSVVNGNADPIDVQVYDLEKAFDALWLEDSMNDLVDTLPSYAHDDKVAMIYEASRSNQVAVNTAVGQTDRVDIPCIVMQGGTWGPIKCSNSIDKIGKKCYDRGEHLYLYKERVQVLPLGMVDDIIAVSRCGHPSVALNTYLTTQIELKKLRFHIPDSKGKTKCHQLHIGRKSTMCPELRIHGHKMERVDHDVYLGDMISSDGKNNLTVKDRVGKANGIMADISNTLDTISFGSQFFRMFKLLREAQFVNGTLTNADIWYGVDDNTFKELEDVDRQMIRKVLKCPFSTPREAGHLELGLLPLNIIVKERRVNYLHYVLTSDKTRMLYKFFVAQWEDQTKCDWTERIREDLADLNIEENFNYIQSKSKESFKNTVKVKIREFALEKLNEAKFKHSKMDSLVYTDLNMQEYLLNEEISVEQKQTIFQFRTHMANFASNYGEINKPCKICQMHIDCQAHSVVCNEIPKNICKDGKYEEIYTNNISRETAVMLHQIVEHRRDKLG